MDTELFKKLIADPSRWPYYLLLAAIIIFVLKIINVATEAVAKHLSDKLKERKGFLSLFKAGTQVVAIALIIYIANAVYWSRIIEQLVPSSTDKPINTCETTVELVIESDNKSNTHYMDRGGYLAFGIENHSLLVTVAPDSWGRSISPNEYMYRGLFKMDVADSAVGKPVKMLLDAQYVQVMFHSAPKDFSLIRGKAICVINSEVRFDLIFLAQEAIDGQVFIRNLEAMKSILK